MNTTSTNLQRLNDAIAADRLRQGSWGDSTDPQGFVCALSAVVPGAHSTADACPILGVPVNALDLFVGLFDSAPATDAITFAREFFANDLTAVNWPRAIDQFNVRLLTRLPAQSEHVVRVSALLVRRLAGEDVEEELRATTAWAAAWAAARAAWAAAWAAARAAAWAAAWAAAAGAVERDRQRQDFINILHA